RVSGPSHLSLTPRRIRWLTGAANGAARSSRAELECRPDNYRLQLSTLEAIATRQESDLWSIASGRWKLLSAFVLAGIVVGIALILVLPRLYRVQTTVLTVNTENPTSAQTGVARS